MTTLTHSVPSISCEGCVCTIQGEVRAPDGVQSLKVNLATKQVGVFDIPASDDKFKSLLADINYPAVK